MKIIHEKEGIGIALGIVVLVFAVSMILFNSDGSYISKVSAQEANSTAIQEPTDKLDQIQAKFKELVEKSGINTTSLTLSNNANISEVVQKLNSTKVLIAIANAYNQALEQAGVASPTEGLKEKYGGDLSMLVQKFNEIKANSSR
jgi:hypothetical protein